MASLQEMMDRARVAEKQRHLVVLSLIVRPEPKGPKGRSSWS